MKNEPVILNTSDEAAKKVTLTGWVNRHGQFFGADERLARWSGATHLSCQRCGTPHDKLYTFCEACRDLNTVARWGSLKQEAWDQSSPVCLFDGDEYFFDVESFVDWCADQSIKPSEVRLVHCLPQYLSTVDEGYWTDDLAEDGELPPEIGAALDELNAKIAAHAEPISWVPSNVAVDPASLEGLEAA